MRLDEQSWTDAQDADTRLALLPVGSTEQHGPHAPLGVDSTTAEAIAVRAADRYEAENDEQVVVAPTVPVGVAEEHRAFDGSLWVTEDTLRAYVGDVLRSLAGHGFDRAVVVNGHGGNSDALREICARVTRDGDCRAVSFTWFDDLDTDLPLGHGGPVETSAMLALRPDLVHEDRFPEAAEGGAGSFGRFVAGTNVAYDFDEFSESGNVGDPTPATAEEGERLLAGAAGSVCAVLDAIR